MKLLVRAVNIFVPLGVPASIRLIVLTIACAQVCQASPLSLIQYLTYRSGRPGKVERARLFECGMNLSAEEEDRRAANALVKFGQSALPALEAALDSLEKQGVKSPYSFNAVWLLIAYAKLRGPEAYPKLRRMIGNPAFRQSEIGVDNSIAVSLGLTSYVETSQTVLGVPLMCRAREPRDALDRLVLAWEKDNYAAIRDSLGPHGKAALLSLMAGHSWAALRKEPWRRGAIRPVALGYKLAFSGPRGQPRESLDESAAAGLQVDLATTLAERPQTNVHLFDKSGTGCAVQRIAFVADWEPLRSIVYYVDNADLKELFLAFASCAGKSGVPSLTTRGARRL